MRPPQRGEQLALLSIAMLLGMAPWFSATVAAPAMLAEWRLADATGTWLTMAVQLGFVAGTCVSALLLLSDRWSARRLAAGSALLAAGTTAALALDGVGPVSAVVLRVVTGFALAGVYPPGIKIAAGWWRERRGMAIGVLIGALTLGSASPNLFRLVRVDDWRTIVMLAALSSLGASMLFFTAVREGPYQAPSAPFDPRALRRVVRERDVVLATGGYLGHMWELYAVWGSLPAFWAFVAAKRGLPGSAEPLLAFLTIASGAIGCVVAGLIADRVGRATVTIWAMAASGLCSAIIGLLVDAPLGVLLAVALVWGATVVADSAQFSACVTEAAPPAYVGTAVTMQTCLGFLLTTVTIRMVPILAERWGWERAFIPLALGPLLGILAMARLRRGEKRSSIGASPSGPFATS